MYKFGFQLTCVNCVYLFPIKYLKPNKITAYLISILIAFILLYQKYKSVNSPTMSSIVKKDIFFLKYIYISLNISDI